MASKKTVLIAGGAGFLGSHLSRHYINDSVVVCLDDLSTGRKENIEELLDNPNFHFVDADICLDLKTPLKDFKKIDVVINLASPASPPRYKELALETLRVGSQGTYNLLKVARDHKARFFHASTSEVYGDPAIHPQPESYWGNVNPYGPRSMYDESKRFAEALIYVYRHKYGVSTAIGRFFNTYGPNMDPEDGRVVSNFIVQALQGEPLTMYGDGKQTRSFCYVSDLVDGIVKMIESDEEGPMNLGNPSEFTMMELAVVVLNATGSKSKIRFLPQAADDPTQRKPMINQAREKLGWEPQVMLEDGVRRTIKYYQDQLEKRDKPVKTRQDVWAKK